MPVRTLIFAKAPCAGIAKTRLIPALGAQGAARLAQRMLHHSVNEAIAARIGAVELCATPAIDDSAWAGQSLPRSISCSDQGAGDLGERMARAAQRTLHEGESLLLIGTDCPALDARRLQCAAQALQQVDCVITPHRRWRLCAARTQPVSPLAVCRNTLEQRSSGRHHAATVAATEVVGADPADPA